MHMLDDNIVAISTPPGEAGISIIRLSGDIVIDLIKQVFVPYYPDVDISNKPGFSLTLGWIVDNQGHKIDEVLLGIMRDPHSYTGENMVEINCHGGALPVHKCLERCLQIGLRIAEPGEFTKRAFLNGRMDIIQAEAVIDIIRSKSEKGLQLALHQLEGENKKYVNELEDKLISLNAMVEASMDFPDDVGELDYEESTLLLKEILIKINKFIAAGERNEIYLEGIKLAICGKPNVGKSSLLNALVKKEKAIVTNVPGTTRDVIEEYINIRGIPVKVMDTAGIRLTDDIVERIGVDKSREVIKQADLIIFLLDFSTGITNEDMDIYKSINKDKMIVLVNKEDLTVNNISEADLKNIFKDIKVIKGSIKNETGLEELEEAIESRVLMDGISSDHMEVMFNLRQKNALLKCREYIESALNNLENVPLDCLEIDLWGALEALGEISGRTLKEEVIDRIFHDFCIGK